MKYKQQYNYTSVTRAITIVGWRAQPTNDLTLSAPLVAEIAMAWSYESTAVVCPDILSWHAGLVSVPPLDPDTPSRQLAIGLCQGCRRAFVAPVYSSPFYTASPHYLRSSGSPMVIHTEQSTSAVPPWKSHGKPALRLLKWRDGTHHVDDVGVSQVPPVNLNPWTVYNHMDAVIMCSD